MNIKEIIVNGANKLKEKNIQDSNIKARLLLQYVLNQDKSYLVVNCEKQVNEQEEKKYNQYIQELIQGKPLQYITKAQEFMGLDFYVDENVLIPQPDTEILVEEAIKEIENIIEEAIEKRKEGNWEIQNVRDTIQFDKTEDKAQNSTIRILDMCTGSGAIAISIAKYFQEKNANIAGNTDKIHLQKQNNEKTQRENQSIEIQVYALDISEEALKIAQKNAKSNGVNVTFFKSNMFERIKENVEEKFDIIVSNPPYIETEVIQTLEKEVKNEPHLALDGGLDGLDFYKIIAKEGKNYLKENGAILLEIGYNQKESVTKLFKKIQEYTNIECIQDLARNDRVVKIYN